MLMRQSGGVPTRDSLLQVSYYSPLGRRRKHMVGKKHVCKSREMGKKRGGGAGRG